MEVGDAAIEGSEQDEVARLRRLVRLQRAFVGSILLHSAIVIGLLLTPRRELAETAAEAAAARAREPVTVTFVAPRPPAPAFRSTPPPPVRQDRPFRMQPAPEPQSAKGRRHDDRKPGGAAGGPLPSVQAGAPDPGEARESSSLDAQRRSEAPPASEDLSGRLRDFRRAMERVERSSSSGPKGGGAGAGGAQAPSLPASGFGFGNLEFESRDYDWSDYARAIYVAIWRAWHNRLYMTSGVFERWAVEQRNFELDHTARVRFTISESGEVVGVEVEGPSGCIPLDDSAADALREVVLPPLPSDFPRGQETVHARFIAEGDIRVMRSNLQWLKSQGWF